LQIITFLLLYFFLLLLRQPREEQTIKNKTPLVS